MCVPNFVPIGPQTATCIFLEGYTHRHTHTILYRYRCHFNRHERVTRENHLINRHSVVTLAWQVHLKIIGHMWSKNVSKSSIEASLPNNPIGNSSGGFALLIAILLRIQTKSEPVRPNDAAALKIASASPLNTIKHIIIFDINLEHSFSRKS